MTASLAWPVSGPPGTAAGDNKSEALEVAKPHRKGRWRGTWLLSKFREQRGVWRKRGRTICITDHDCAGEGVSMNRDSSAGAVHGLGKRGTSVGIANHGRAGMGEPRSGEDAESVGSPDTQRNVVRGEAGTVTERSDGAVPADAARRGAVDIADHGGIGARAAVPGVSPARDRSTRDKPGARGRA